MIQQKMLKIIPPKEVVAPSSLNNTISEASRYFRGKEAIISEEQN
jgi:hypothetical protein